MKNAFYFTLKAFFILKVFKFLSWLFGHVGIFGLFTFYGLAIPNTGNTGNT